MVPANRVTGAGVDSASTSAGSFARLWCPRCVGASLAREDGGGCQCSACGRRYPLIGSIPCLVPDPSLWRSLWLHRLAEFLSTASESLQRWSAEAADADLLPRTRDRLARVLAGSEAQRAQVQDLFGDLLGAEPQLLPTRPEVEGHAVLTFYEHIFRDWVWGEKEIDATREIIARLVKAPLGRLAVHGAGAGRLAVDLHQHLEPEETWATDLNPLPILVAERLVRGQTVTLPEFPVAPHGEGDVVVSRRLGCPVAVRAGFSFLFADAFRPPFAPGSLDAVVTCWFIDASGRDVRETAAAINRVLRPGGAWINVGPLRFKKSLASSYTIEEVWDVVEASGFVVTMRARDEVPYFDSPVSGSRRMETVFSFRAEKRAEAPAADGDGLPPFVAVEESEESVPAWIADDTLPVPLTPALVALGRKSMFAGSVIALIDGSRSLSQVAEEMGRLWGFDAPRIKDQLRAFFASIQLDD